MFSVYRPNNQTSFSAALRETQDFVEAKIDDPTLSFSEAVRVTDVAGVENAKNSIETCCGTGEIRFWCGVYLYIMFFDYGH